MPLKMTLRGENRMGPAIVCDHCGEEIDDARDGNVQWNMDEPGAYKDVFFTHKHCVRAFEGGKLWASNELSSLPVRIAANLAMDVQPERGDKPGTAAYVLRGEVLDL